MSNELRRRAEARLAEMNDALQDGEQDLQRLVHELRVHQIELELQNEDLAASRDTLHQQNAELDFFNKQMVGRELTIVELKKQVNALCRALGRESPYPVGLPPEGANIYQYFSGNWT